MIFGREIPPMGEGEIYLLGEAPGEKEERAGVPFIGSSGNLLFSVLRRLGVSRNQVRIANVFWRRPPFNSIAKAKESKEWTHYCESTKADILTKRPKLVIPLGTTALQLLFPGASIEALRGYLLEWNGIPVLPTYHPAAVLRKQDLLLPFSYDLKKAVYFVKGLLVPPPDPELKLRSPSDFVLAAENALHSPLIAIDIETREAPPWGTTVIGIAFQSEDNVFTSVTAPPTPEVVEATGLLLREAGDKLVFHNATFDLSVLKGEFGLDPVKPPHDTMVMHHILFPQQRKALEYITSLHLVSRAWKHISAEDLHLYNAYDCFNTLLLAKELLGQLQNQNLIQVYEQKRKELLPAIFMGLLGCRLDEAKRQELLLQIREQQEAKLQEIWDLVPEARGVNLGSHKQLKQLLYNVLHVPPVVKKGSFSTDQEAIKKMKNKVRSKNPRAHKFLNLYQEWRVLKDIESKDLKVKACSWTGKIHTSYSVIGTITARWSSSAPTWGNKRGAKHLHGTNFQNRQKEFRSFYLPPKEGWVFVGADYGGAEARIVAFRCNDEQSKKAFAEGKDIHKVTASLMFGLPESKITKELRSIGKRIRHAANYDMSWRKLMDLMDISAAEAKDLLSRYHAAFPKIRSVFHKKTEELVRKERQLFDAWGLRLPFRGRIDAEVLREAYAFYPQSTCTHTLNKALISLWEWTKSKSWVALQFQIHDEIVLTCEPPALPEVAEQLQKAMSIEIPIFDLDTEKEEPLVLPIEFKFGRTWDMAEFPDMETLLNAAKEEALI